MRIAILGRCRLAILMAVLAVFAGADVEAGNPPAGNRQFYGDRLRPLIRGLENDDPRALEWGRWLP